MDTSDHIEKHECGETPKNASITDAIEKNEIVEIPKNIFHSADSEKEDIHPRVKSVLRVIQTTYDAWAELEVEYSWNASGTSFTCNTLRYRVKANGRHRGNIIFGFSSATAWGGDEISNDNASQDGDWHNISAGGTVAGNARTALIYFKYIFDVPIDPDPWAEVRWTLTFSLAPPTITNPRVVRVPRPTLSGTGVAGAFVKLYQHNVGTILFATTTVEDTNTWEVTLTEPLWMADPFTMTASQTLNGIPSGWAPPTNFAVLFKPVISSITVSADGRPTVSGTGGLKDATIEIYLYIGTGGVQLTTTVQPNGTWSARADDPWVPKTYIIYARQIGPVTGMDSDFGDPQTFTVKPPKPVITNPRFVWIPRPTISGTGVAGALVKLYEHNVGSVVLGEDTVKSGNTWTVTLTQPLRMADPFTMTASQTLNDIPSDWADPISFAVLFKLVISSITVSADGRPTVSGTGVLQGATVDIRFQGGAATQLIATVQPGGSWSATASAPWAPNTYTITAKQIGRVTQQSSDWADHRTFTVAAKPPKPVITALPDPIPANQRLNITGVYSGTGTVTLAMFTVAGFEISGSFSPSTGTTRTFTPTPDWAPGTQQVKVVQTVDGLASDPSDLATLRVRPPKLAITALPDPVPSNQQLTITNVYSDLSVLTMLTEAGAEIRGAFSVTGASRTFRPTADWAPGTQRVKVVQQLSGAESEPSDLATLRVQPPKPTITALPDPVPSNQQLTITGVYSGTGTVTLKMLTEAGAEISGTFSATGATRTFTPSAHWAPGTQKVKVVQTVGGVASDSSNLSTLVVKPPKPTITALPDPVPSNQQLTITGVYSGTGTVTLKMLTEAGAEISGTFSSTTGTTRTFTPTPDWTPGTQKVKVVQTVGGVASDSSNLSTLMVKPPIPVITNPGVVWIPQPTISGTGVVGALVKLHKHTVGGVALGEDTVNDENAWAATLTQPLPMADPFIMTASQTLNGIRSDWADPVSFAVLFKLVISDITVSADGRPTVSGTGVFEGATVDIRFQGGAATQLTATVEPDGSWLATASAPWPSNTYTITAKQIGRVTQQSSDWADHKTFTVTVKPPKPAITAPPNPAPADQVLTITGVSSDTVTLTMLTEAGAEIPGSFSPTTGTTRTFTPEAGWEPGTQKVKVVQTVDGVPSDPSDLATLRVRPPKPTIAAPSDPTPADQVLTITDVYSDTVTLRMLTDAGSDVRGSFSPTGTTRTFTPGTNWAPGTHRVKVAQTVDDVPSEPSDLATLRVQPPKPAITALPGPVPASQPLTITGVYSGTVTLTMLTEAGAEVSGRFSPTGTTRTFTPTTNWTAGPHQVKVVQTVGGVESDPSDGCTFTVESEDKPEAPQFELPLPGSRTSTRPLVRVIGQPRALMTVRPEGAETLHSDTASTEGVLEFVVATPLPPGPNALEVKQKGDGPESDWSELHRFTVKELPQTPVIDAPTPGSLNPRKPTIRGKGETRGQILLRHEDDPENLIDTLNGLTSWRWTAQASWEVGQYTIQAQQTDDGDGSSWTEPRTFEVIDARYGVGDAGPVLAQPVLSNNESVLLRVQVVSGVTGEAAEGVTVEWRIAGEQSVLATTVTGPDGWARYLYTPGTAGEHTVLADLTNENQGVVITQPFEVTALPDDVWAQTFELYLEGEKVDLAMGDLALLDGKSCELRLEVNSAGPLTGASVTLEDLSEAETLGLEFAPPLGTPQPLVEGQSVQWSITCDTGKSGYFGLKLTSSILPDWHLPGRVIAQDLSEEVEVHFDIFAQVFGGAPAYPCLGATHTLTVRPKARSLLLGKDVTLELTDEAVDLGVTVSPAPDTPQPLGADGVSWSLNCVDSSKNGRFAVRLKVREWDFSSLELPMSLGHNKVEITERFGPVEMGGSASYWRYGIRATSTFTGQPAGGVPVTVAISGKPPGQGTTAQTGWIHVNYYDDESASLTIRNLYDGSYA